MSVYNEHPSAQAVNKSYLGRTRLSMSTSLSCVWPSDILIKDRAHQESGESTQALFYPGKPDEVVLSRKLRATAPIVDLIIWRGHIMKSLKAALARQFLQAHHTLQFLSPNSLLYCCRETL